jgi:hypothetical protein
LLYIFITFPPVMAGNGRQDHVFLRFRVGDVINRSVRDKELQVFPGLSNASIEVADDSTVIATVCWKTSKAIF